MRIGGGERKDKDKEEKKKTTAETKKRRSEQRPVDFPQATSLSLVDRRGDLNDALPLVLAGPCFCFSFLAAISFVAGARAEARCVACLWIYIYGEREKRDKLPLAGSLAEFRSEVESGRIHV